MSGDTRDQAHVLSDQGGVNARILAREAKVDFRRIEAASLKLSARFTSAEGKRLFVRLFNTLQLNAHFISVIARSKLDVAEIQRAELGLRTRLEAATAILNEAIDAAEVQFKAQGITGLASYDALPMEVDVHVLSSTGRRYLELLVKLDQLMPMLQTLEIHEVLSTEEMDQQRARIKRQAREVANIARRHATNLRRRMNALDAAGSRGGGREGAPRKGPVDGEPGSEGGVSADVVDDDDQAAHPDVRLDRDDGGSDSPPALSAGQGGGAETEAEIGSLGLVDTEDLPPSVAGRSGSAQAHRVALSPAQTRNDGCSQPLLMWSRGSSC